MRLLTPLLLLAAAGTALPAVAQAPTAVSVEAKTPDYEFSYSYPAAATRFAPLKTWLEADRAALRQKLMRDVVQAKRDAKKDGYPYRTYTSQREWKVVTETPRLLSLSGSTYNFSGGAHGNTASSGLLWDKAARRRLAPLDVFVSRAALASAIGRDLCAALNVQREKRRGAPVRPNDPNDIASFNGCPKLSEGTVILGSTNRRAIDRIGVILDPYVAGPYAEGSYDLTVPVTPAVLRAVKPAWRGAFAVR